MKKKDQHGEKKDFYLNVRGQYGVRDSLFDRPVGEELQTITMSRESFEKLVNPYGRMLGIPDNVMEEILKDSSDGDVLMAKVMHAYRAGRRTTNYEG